MTAKATKYAYNLERYVTIHSMCGMRFGLFFSLLFVNYKCDICVDGIHDKEFL